MRQATVTIPLMGVRFLYHNTRAKKVVCEIDIASLKRVNEPTTIDEMIAESQLEYVSGKTKGFRSTKKLMAYLRQ